MPATDEDVDRLVAEEVARAAEIHPAQPVDPAVDTLVADTIRLVNAGPEGTKRDATLLFAARFVRMFAFASMTVVLLLLLSEAGLSGPLIGVLLSLTMVGDLGLTFFLTTQADKIGRKQTLLAGCALALLSAIVFGTSTSFTLLLIAGILGVISPAGGEVGPFLAVEQAALADLKCRDGSGDIASVAATFGKYQFVGELAKAVGTLVAGAAVVIARDAGSSPMAALRMPVYLFGLSAVLMAVLYRKLSAGIEVRAYRTVDPSADSWKAPATELTGAERAPRALLCGIELGLRQESGPAVLKLSALFAIDAFAGGFTMHTYLAFYFHERWALDLAALGGLLAAVNVVAGMSSMVAGPLVRRFGAVNTMVFTHLPSNLLLMLVPLMGSREAAAAMLVLRYTISQMDVPARQAYVAMLVESDERSAAGGITTVARSVGLIFSPLLLGQFMAAPAGSSLLDAPFYIAGLIKIAYDLAVWHQFRAASAR